jgi:hypothetical protein
MVHAAKMHTTATIGDGKGSFQNIKLATSSTTRTQDSPYQSQLDAKSLLDGDILDFDRGRSIKAVDVHPTYMVLRALSLKPLR